MTSKMKVFVIIVGAFIACAYSLGDEDVSKEWQQYKSKYGKIYRTSDEETKRFDIFKKHFFEIKAHNERYEKGETSFNQEINEFADWSDDELYQFNYDGLVDNSLTLSASGDLFNKTEGFVLPESIDWRDYGVVTEVQDQVSTKCASCWTFASTGTVEAQLALKTGKLISLSKQNLIDCTLDRGNHGCSSGYTSVVYDYIKENGIESEEDYPYEAKIGECRFNSSKSVTKLSGYVAIPPKDELALQEAIAKIGPIKTSLDFSTFMFYKSGILDESCSTTWHNHAILLIGFGSENGKDFYIGKNSFGPEWGESGYFRIGRNVGDKCCFAYGALYPIL